MLHGDSHAFLQASQIPFAIFSLRHAILSWAEAQAEAAVRAPGSCILTSKTKEAAQAPSTNCNHLCCLYALR